jgi:ribosomal protein L11 methyltransferase
LDPGLAFGTGTHPTTALCLEWLESHPLDDCELIDYGCGSGILAIAAIKLGARFAWAVDIDARAHAVTLENAEKNNILANRISTIAPESLPAVEADLVVANILSGPLMELSRILASMTRPGGRIILSGILIDQAHVVANKYAEFFTMGPPKTKEGWVLLEGERIGK